MREHDAVEAVLRAAERNDDGSIDEKTLIDEIAKLLDFDADAERRNKASRVVRRHKMPGFGERDGQLTLPGVEPYAYEPDRLIADYDGRIVEQARAGVEFKRAEAWRAREAARKQQGWADRKTNEHDAFAAWALKETLAGRPERELTFGDFVRETGTWSPGAAESEHGPPTEDG